MIVCDFNGAATTVKLCETGVAAAYVPLPACEACIVQVPAATNVALVPLTVQMPVVCEAKLTANPELAVAASVNGVPTVCAPGLANVIVWGWSCAPASTVKLRIAGIAGAYVILPVCVARIVQTPATGRFAVVPDTVQTCVVSETNLTGSPEVAVAFSARLVPALWFGIAGKLIDCGRRLCATAPSDTVSSAPLAAPTPSRAAAAHPPHTSSPAKRLAAIRPHSFLSLSNIVWLSLPHITVRRRLRGALPRDRYPGVRHGLIEPSLAVAVAC